MLTEIYHHYVITRFNLRREGWDTARNGSLVLTEDWLRNRFILFEKFCLTAMQIQTNRNFTLLVFCDMNTSEKYRQKALEHNLSLPNFQPFFINGMPEFLPSIENEIRKNIRPYTISSRLDNDDCVSKNFINEIQLNFEKQNFLVLDFPDGYTLQINPSVKIGKRKQLFNPFISIIEKSEGAKSVWQREAHSSWKREKNIKRINDKRIWMSVIHFENKKNKYEGYGEVDVETVFEDFVLDNELKSKIINRRHSIATKLESVQNNLSSHWRTLYKNIKRKTGLYN